MSTTGPDHLRFFPYDRPYDRQREAMERIHSALEDGRDVLFEGACGTGKTMAALAPALQHAREHDRTVVITTNVHQQMRQFIAEARRITREEPIRAVVFRGKTSMCHIDVGYDECQVLRDNTRDLVDVERDERQLEHRQQELLEQARAGDDDAADARAAVMDELDNIAAERDDLEAERTCDRFYTNLTRDDESFRAWLYEDVRTPDEVYDRAHERGLCGYELLKESMDAVDLVVCNYHHLLSPMIREQFFRWLDRDPDEVITVFDEAHNIADAARDHATRTLAEGTLDGGLAELQEVDDDRVGSAENVVDGFRTALRTVYGDALDAGTRVGPDWEDVVVANEDRRDDLTLAFLETYGGRGIDADLEAALALGRDLDASYEEAYRRGQTETRKECPTLTAATFVKTFLEEGAATGQYPVVSVRRDDRTGDVTGRAELYTCIPREVTAPLFEEVHASVLMSATLRPFDVTREVLGLADPETMAYGLAFPRERRRTYAVDVPPLFARDRDDPAVTRTVTDLVADACRFTPGNVLCFFPSYAEAARYAGLVDVEGVTVYEDEPGVRAEDLREAFVADGNGALFTSLWGTLTEGVSFDGDDARTVVVVGVPYPHLDDRTEAVQEAYAETFGDHAADAGWRYAVEVPTIRKTRQALGRVLRSPEDFGVRILADRRYTSADMGRYGVRGTFPREEREELIDVLPEKLKYALLNFYDDLDAWDGLRPQP